MAETTSWTDIIGGLSQGIVVPLVQKEVLGQSAASELALARESAYFNSLNGSGAPNPAQQIANASTGTELNNPAKFSWGNPLAVFTQSKVAMIAGAVLILLLGVVLFRKLR